MPQTQTKSRQLEEDPQDTDSHTTAGALFSKVTSCLSRKYDSEKQVSVTRK